MTSTRTWHAVTAVVLTFLALIGVGLAILQTFRAGANWDLSIELRNFAAIRGLDPSIGSLEAAYEVIDPILTTYGVFFWALANGIFMVAGGGAQGLGIGDSTSLVWFGALGVALSAFTAVVLAVVVGKVLQARWVGVFAGALLVTTPMWLGHSAMNFKDVTFAEGLTLISLGLIVVATWNSKRFSATSGAVLAGLGATLALGVRGSSGPLILAVLVGSAALLSVQLWLRGPRARIPLIWVASGIAAVLALLVTWLTNPFARISLGTWLVDAFELSRRFPTEMTVRTLGSDVPSNDAPWWYIPAWLSAQLPLAAIAVVILGIVGLVVTLKDEKTRWRVLTFLPLAIQGLLLPLVMVVSGAVLYDAIRHVLFVIPFLVAVSAVGVWWLDSYLRRGSDGQGRAWRTAVAPVLSIIVVASSLIGALRWAPYSYAYVNLPATMGTQRAWELDYWGLSVREGAERLRELGLEPIYVLPNSEAGAPFGTKFGNELSDLLPGSTYGLYVFERWDQEVPPGCSAVFSIVRSGEVLGEGYQCVSR